MQTVSHFRPRACMRGHCCTMRRPNSETVQAYNFEAVAFFLLREPAIQTKSKFRRRTRLRGHRRFARRSNSAAVPIYDFGVSLVFCATRLYKLHRMLVDAPACVATADLCKVPFDFRGGSNLRFWGVRSSHFLSTHQHACSFVRCAVRIPRLFELAVLRRSLVFRATRLCKTKSHFRRRTRLERQSLICSPFEFRGGSHLRFLGVRLFFAPPGYTNGIACSSTHPLERPPLICSPLEVATVQVYGFWAFAGFAY